MVIDLIKSRTWPHNTHRKTILFDFWGHTALIWRFFFQFPILINDRRNYRSNIKT